MGTTRGIFVPAKTVYVPATLKLLPPSYRLGALQEDYSAMRNMLYGEIPSFETMMEAVGELEKEIHAL